MMKFREKWFWALCLAILVHAGVFSFFYFNTNQTGSVELADGRANTTKPATISSINLPSDDKSYTTTVTSTTTPDSSSDSPAGKALATHSKAAKLTSIDKPLASSKNKNTVSSQAYSNIDDKPKKPTSISKEAAQEDDAFTQDNKRLKKQTEQSAQPIVANSNDDLEEIKNNASLLNIDVPTQKSDVEIDKDYLSAKSEVEEINNQLSAAINEVKKRNQLKIDARQQLSNEANIKDGQNLTKNSN